MVPTPRLDSYLEDLLRAVALENVELRELLVAVAQELEKLAAHYPQFAPRILARSTRLRARLVGRDSVTATDFLAWRSPAPFLGVPSSPQSRAVQLRLRHSVRATTWSVEQWKAGEGRRP